MKYLFMTAAVLAFCGLARAQWSPQVTGFASPLKSTSVSIVNDSTVWVSAMDTTSGASAQAFSRTSNGGTSWAAGSINGAVGFHIANIHARSSSMAWAALYKTTGDSGGVYKTTNGGTAWTRQSTATFGAPNGHPNFVHFFNDTIGITVGNPNGNNWEIYRTTNGGTAWTRIDSSKIPTPQAAEMGLVNGYKAIGNTVWFLTTEAAGPGIVMSRIYRTNNQGTSWFRCDSINEEAKAIAFRDTANGLIITASGMVAASSNGGRVFSALNTAGSANMGALAFVPSTAGLYVSTDANGSSFSADNGTTWTSIDVVSHAGALAFSKADFGWSGDFNADATTGGIYRWSCAITPPTVLTDSNYYCVGATINDIQGSGANLSWYDSADLTNLLASSSTLSGSLISVTDTFYVTQTTTGCPQSNAANVDVHVEEYPNLIATDPSPICAPFTVNLTLGGIIVDSMGTDGTYSYWNNAGATTAFATPTAAGVTAGTHTYYVYKTTRFASCHSDTVPVVVLVHPSPSLSVSEPAAVCAPATINLSGLTVTDANNLPGAISYWTDQSLATAVTTPSAVSQSGTYYILKVTTLGSCKDTVPVALTIIELCASINEAQGGSALEVYPNPSNGMVYLNTGSLNANASIRVINVIGQEIMNTTVGAAANGIDLSAAPKGMYFIQLRSDKRTSTVRMILN